MNIRWSVKDMPELADLSQNDKQVLMMDAFYASFSHWQMWAGAAFCLLCGQIGGIFGNTLGGILGGTIGGGVWAPIALRMQAIEIRKIVAKRKGAKPLKSTD